MIGTEEMLAERSTKGDWPVPEPLPEPPAVPEPDDVPYPGILQVEVDATDIERRIFDVRQRIPVSRSGELILLYPKWLPGFHAPQAPIELFAGLRISAGDAALTWKRHPVTVNAFRIDVPEGVAEIEARFQFLSPTDASQGRVLCTPDLLCLPWNTVILYPAGHYARQVEIEARLILPTEWHMACVLDHRQTAEGTWTFSPVSVDTLVDSPVFAGRHCRRVELDQNVALTIFGDDPDLLDATPEQLAAHRAVVEQGDRLFRSRHFDRFEMLLALSEELSPAGVEHHRSFEAVSSPDYFTNWDQTSAHRDTIPHEFVHSWNGKYRRGADSWQPCFEKPIRNSLMWVYEGLTQYWTQVLAARSGLWTAEQAMAAIAISAARYDVRPGSLWRPTIDTTRDPIIAARSPLPWPSWQRSEDYYAEGALIWLDVDTRLRELTGETRSLDDFARAFFGGNDGVWTTHTYRVEDVVDALHAVAPFDWAGFFEEQLTETHERAPLGGLERGGCRLVYRGERTPFQASQEAVLGQIDLSHSLGLTVSSDGVIKDVLWGGPAFDAHLTIGATILAVNGRTFDPVEIDRAIAERAPPSLAVTKGRRVRTVTIDYRNGPRFPHIEPIPDAPPRLLDILQPLHG